MDKRPDSRDGNSRGEENVGSQKPKMIRESTVIAMQCTRGKRRGKRC